MTCCISFLLIGALTASPGTSEVTWSLDERPGEPGEWGFHPADAAPVDVTPPGFVWRPQARARRYHLQVSPTPNFDTIAYEARDLDLYYHCPPRPLPPGTWHWRFRGIDQDGMLSRWSSTRTFIVSDNATEMPLPPRAELLGRVPSEHPRLFVRPEDLPRLRELARSAMSEQFARLVLRCDELVKKPPPTTEPQMYPPSMERKSEEWRVLWWGNRLYTIDVLESAATLAFVYRLGGDEKYAELARRLLMDAAGWNPTGATGYRYNDEAGMPYAYHFSRTYSFLHDRLSEDERRTCRQVMRVRGREMYTHLHPRHIWSPYSSHSNRAWHFLGEVGIAFHGEIPEADDWLWFAMNVFYHAYPVWSDTDGGWHEGLAYWRSYIGRFTWWADVMRSSLAIDAYRKPYFSQIGYYAMYLQPPGTRGGGFGDLCPELESGGNVPLMQIFAAQTGNAYWQWYVQAHGKPRPEQGYIGFLRGALPTVRPREPSDLPASRCFRGTGVAVMNTNLLDAKRNVEVLFKSSPLGTQSHGYDANNAFILYAFGEPLFVSSGRRDIYGSDHHAKWMWHTKSTNSITIDGEGQLAHSARTIGCISDFETTPEVDYVAGEAADAYGGALRRFTRRILFIKPELIVIHDLLEASRPSSFEWLLHSPVRMQLLADQRVRVVSGPSACDVTFLHPQGLNITQTDLFDPPPRARIKLVEHHLTASTGSGLSTEQFVTVFRPHHQKESVSRADRLLEIEGGWALESELSTGKALSLLRDKTGIPLQHSSVTCVTDVAVFRYDSEGQLVHTFRPAASNHTPARTPQ